MKENLKDKLFALINVEQVLNYYDKRVEEKTKEVLTFFINNLKEQKNKLPENWESLIDYYLKSVVECTNYELLDWAKGTQTNGIKYYLKKVGSFVLKEQVDFYQLLISALYVCIKDVVKDTIKKAKEQKLFKILIIFLKRRKRMGTGQEVFFEKLFSLVSSRKILGYKDYVAEKKTKEILKEYFLDIGYDLKEQNELNEDWEEELFDFIDYNIRLHDSDLLKWAGETLFQGVDLYFKEQGTGENVRSSDEIFQIFEKALLNCIKLLAVGTIDLALKKKYLL